jgi:hypothetical protein
MVMQWLRTNFFFSRNKFGVQIFFFSNVHSKMKVGSSNVFSLQNFIHFLTQVAQGKKKMQAQVLKK